MIIYHLPPIKGTRTAFELVFFLSHSFATPRGKERVEKVLPSLCFMQHRWRAPILLSPTCTHHINAPGQELQGFFRPIYKVQNPQTLVAKTAKKHPFLHPPRMLNQFWGGRYFKFQFLMNLKQKILHMILGDFLGKTKIQSLTVKATHVVFGCPPQSPCYMRKSTLKIDRYCFLVMQGFSKFLGLFKWLWQTPFGCQVDFCWEISSYIPATVKSKRFVWTGT